MSEAESAASIRLSDPLPSRCSACFTSPATVPDQRFVNFNDTLFSGSTLVGPENQVIEGVDRLHLCEACVKAAAETLAFKPQLHRKQLLEIRRLDSEVDHWKQTARRLQRELNAQLTADLA